MKNDQCNDIDNFEISVDAAVADERNLLSQNCIAKIFAMREGETYKLSLTPNFD